MELGKDLIERLSQRILDDQQIQVEYIAEYIRDEEETTYMDALVFVWEEVLSRVLEKAIISQDDKLNS